MWLSIAYTFYACMMLHGCQHACAHITLGSLYDPILVPVLARHYCHSSPHARHLANISHTLWEKKLRLSEGTCPEGAWLTHSWVQGIHYVSVKRMVQQCLSYWGGKCIPIPHCEGGSTVSQEHISGRRIPASLTSGLSCTPAALRQPPHQSEEETHGHGCRGQSPPLTHRGFLVPEKPPQAAAAQLLTPNQQESRPQCGRGKTFWKCDFVPREFKN